jgi:hypothetical protein
MYLLKVKTIEGYEYFPIPPRFTFEKIRKDTRFTKAKEQYIISVDENCIPPLSIKEDHLGFIITNHCKRIHYLEDKERIEIFFDGDAYLIKENGKTVEKF